MVTVMTQTFTPTPMPSRVETFMESVEQYRRAAISLNRWDAQKHSNEDLCKLFDRHSLAHDALLFHDASQRQLIAEMVESLHVAAEWIAIEIGHIGPCDHDVGICVCGDISMLRAIRAVIAKAGGAV